MKPYYSKIFLLVIFSFTLISRLAAQWEYYSAPVDEPEFRFLSYIKYTSATNLYAVDGAADRIYQSTNGGQSFTSWAAIPNLKSICFIDSLYSIAGTFSGALYKSSNGSQSFERIYITNTSGDTGLLKASFNYQFFFYDSLRGWVINKDTSEGCLEIWTTGDGGDVWEKVSCADIDLTNSLPFSQIRMMQFGDMAMFRNGNRYIKARQYGKYWEEVEVIATTGAVNMNSWVFKDSLNGIQLNADNNASLIHTTTGGASWTPVNTLPIIPYVLDYASGIAGGAGFYIACAQTGNKGCYVSFDNAGSWKKIDELNHYNVTFYNALAGISVKQQGFSTEDVRVFNGRPWPVGVNEVALKQSLELYPNPAADKVNISWRDKEISAYSITDITGKIVVEGRVQQSPVDAAIDVSTLSPGLYLLKVQDKYNEQTTGRLNIVH